MCNLKAVETDDSKLEYDANENRREHELPSTTLTVPSAWVRDGQLTRGEVPVEIEYIQSVDLVTTKDPRNTPKVRSMIALIDFPRSRSGFTDDPGDVCVTGFLLGNPVPPRRFGA